MFFLTLLMTTIIIVSFVLLILCIAGMMSAAETAVIATSPGIIQKLKLDGNKKAETLLGILKIKEKVISTLLIGTSIANTLSTTIATGVFLEIFGSEYGTIISSIVMSFLIIVFSEVVPKAIAVAKAEKIALLSTPPLIIVLKVLEPINILLGWITRAFCYIFRIDLTQKISAEDEVRGVIEHHMHEGNVFKDDRDMLGGVLDIRNLSISDIMVHRSKVIALDIDQPTDKIIKTVFSLEHSRIPFWHETSDNIIGILHVKDLMNKLTHHKQDNEINIKELLNDPVFVPDHSLVIQQLHMFRKGQTHIACVVNEYGDLQGIVTMEDILEEIVGQIYDEHDLNRQKIKKVGPDTFVIDGSVPVRDLNRELNWQIPETDATTIGGFITHKLGKIPHEGEYLIDKKLKMVVKNKTDNRIRTIKVKVMSDSTDLSSD